MICEYETQRVVNRFSNRAENYMRYRPAYPPEIVGFLESEMGLRKGQHIVDVGSGTGLFAELLLRQGYNVTCIEPDEDMRHASAKKLATYPGYRMLPARAEQTGLANDSVDIITVAHAITWMNPVATKLEFNRILKPGGRLLIAGNFRHTHTPFLAAYNELKKVFRQETFNEINPGEMIEAFFQPAIVKKQVFPHACWLNFDGLKGLLLSSPGIPLPGHVLYDTLISALVQIFVAYNQNGFVHFEYDTRLFWVE